MTYTLHCYQPELNHDKVYIVKLRKFGSIFTVVAEWGRRGASLQSQTKKTTRNQTEAITSMHHLIGQKLNRGYQVISRVAA